MGMTTAAVRSDIRGVPEEAQRPPRRWHIAVFLAPALLVYTALMIIPLADTLRLSLYSTQEQNLIFVGFDNFIRLFTDSRWSESFWNALRNNVIFFAIHMCIQNPVGIALAAMLSVPRLAGRTFYRTAFFMPTMLSFVIVGFIWKLILSPLWGVAPSILGALGLKIAVRPVAGAGIHCPDRRLADLGVAVRRRPDDADLRGADLHSRGGVGGRRAGWHHRHLAILEDQAAADPADDRHRVDLDLHQQFQCVRSDLHRARRAGGAEFLHRYPGHLSSIAPSSGSSSSWAIPTMGAAIATMMFLIILSGVMIYLFLVQRRIRRYQF